MQMIIQNHSTTIIKSEHAFQNLEFTLKIILSKNFNEL